MIPMRFSVTKTAWLLAMTAPAVLWGPSVATVGNLLLASLLITITVLFGHTVGLHRGIIHRSYRMSEGLRRVFAVLFALTGMGGPRAWLRQHALRDHHQSQPIAPPTLAFDHDVLTDFWWTLCCAPVVEDWSAIGLRAEDDADPWLLFVDRAFYPLQLAQGVLIWGVFGWQAVIIAVCARNALVLVGHWWVGYLAHTCGGRAYRIEGVAEEGRNLLLLGVLSFGEGFHNNHHAAPSCARIGREWWQVDLGWLAIVALERVGFVWDVHRPGLATQWLRRGAVEAGAFTEVSTRLD